MHQRRAEAHGGGEQLLDETVLAAAEAERVESGGGEKFVRITAARMRRGEHERRRLRGRAGDEVRAVGPMGASGERDRSGRPSRHSSGPSRGSHVPSCGFRQTFGLSRSPGAWSPATTRFTRGEHVVPCLTAG